MIKQYRRQYKRVNLTLGMLKQLKHSGVQSELMLVLFHLLSVQMMMKLLPRTQKNVWRTLQELELLVSNKVNSWRTKNLSCFVHLSSIFCFSFLSSIFMHADYFYDPQCIHFCFDIIYIFHGYMRNHLNNQEQ